MHCGEDVDDDGITVELPEAFSLRGDLEGDRFARGIDSPLGPSPRPVSSFVTFFKYSKIQHWFS